MSTFKVEVRKIEKVWKHPNADKLDMARLEDLDYQFVTQKDLYTDDQLVVYFPIDSLLPENLIERFGLTGKLSGPNKNRVKSIKLRGEISQGFVSSVDNLKDILGEVNLLDDVTEKLGVEKYEAPIGMSGGVPGKSRVSTLPTSVPYYDIEGCERYKHIVEYLKEKPVLITEKLEGSNFACGIDNRLIENSLYKDQGGKFVVSRRQTILPIFEEDGTIKDEDLHPFWKVAYKQNFFTLIDDIIDYNITNEENIYQVVLRGEIIGPGIQGNIYKLDTAKVRLFDIMINDKYIDADAFISLIEKGILDEDFVVPILWANRPLKDFLKDKSIKEISNGNSHLNLTILREGIVIRPMVEENYDHFGRLVLKQRSPEYLAKTEF